MLWDTHLEEHEPLHGLVPLQQDDPRLQSSTQILVARVGISHCDANKGGQIPVKTRILAGESIKSRGSEGGAAHRCSICDSPLCRGS